MIIQGLTGDLYGDAVELWRATGLTRPWNDPMDDLTRAMAGPSSTVLAGLDGGRLVATAMVGTDGHRGWVYYLAVSPAAQRRGRGRTMMTACEQWLRARGTPKIQLMVRTENHQVADFYRAIGYLDVDAVVLGRRLDAESHA